MKKCSKCKVPKELSEFNKSKFGKFGRHHYCKECNSKQKKASYNYDKAKSKGVKQTYGISIERVHEMYKDQKGLCGICEKHFEFISKHKGLYIDHDHSSGKVRGLICSSCNSLLGCAKDDIKILKKAIEYLKQ